MIEPMPFVTYIYFAEIIRFSDADTVWLNVDTGFRTWRIESFRLVGVNYPEISTAEGKRLKDLLIQELLPGTGVIIKSEMRPRSRTQKKSFDRYLAQVWSIETGETITQIVERLNIAT